MGSDHSDEQKHFVLVHGLCHGAWSWFKLKPLLEAMGHRVSAFDLLASGINTKVIQQVHTLSDYTMPLLEFMATLLPEEKVVLVGHSFGGMSISLAMEKFPDKISLAVFLSATIPDYVHKPSYVLDKYIQSRSAEDWSDTQISPYGSENESETSILFGPKLLASNLYQLCSKEDLELGKILVRPGSLFLNDLDKEQPFSEKGYGSVTRVCAIAVEDKTIPKEFQRWMISNSPVTEVKELKEVDHMLMLSDPNQVCAYLVDVALRYA
ncbi:polyneuridine-aldehyde esterase [Artemisia annua]|uniref:Polyneuridine-aldehyde esterase n=1 Tax=Artemisia annua TaxID=35608 RepID=A0A2U1KAT4_ARTAN|nr:polyneuridine-aldehyde esterase [Artemisia annua]